jgi:hypothetical protein
MPSCNVGHQGGDVGGDTVVQVVGARFARQLKQGTGCFDERVDLTDMQEAVAAGARHVIIHFGDDQLAGAGRGERAIDAGAEAEVAVVVGRGHLHQHDVERHFARQKEAFDFAEENGRVVGAPFPHGLADVAAEEQAAVAESAGELG